MGQDLESSTRSSSVPAVACGSMSTSDGTRPIEGTDPASAAYTQAQKLGLALGLILGGALIALSSVLPRPSGISPEGYRLLGVAVCVAIWWVTEALPLGATALLPAATFPLLDIMPAREVSQYYASPIIFLLLGGFLLALAVERSGAHRRLALYILLGIGTSPRRLVLGFAVAAALLSMWISNTATALVMMPVALAIADRAVSGAETPPPGRAFGIALLLATGYGASIGGMGTPVGTPPNLIALEALSVAAAAGESFTFLAWAATTVPVVCLLVPMVWFSLTRFYPKVPDDLPLGARPVLKNELRRLGRWRRSETRALGVFAIAAFLWVTRPDLQLADGLVIPGWASLLGLTGTHDGVVAVGAAVLACALPSGDRDGERLLPWATAVQVPWGLVLLFGGGIALSKGFEETGLSSWLGGALASLATGSLTPFVALITLTGTFGTELMSNTALANLIMPVLGSTAREASLDPRALIWPVALACSCAFMMPAATGPNAIVFGTGRLRIIEMVRAGFFANWLAWSVVVLAALLRFPVLRGG